MPTTKPLTASDLPNLQPNQLRLLGRRTAADLCLDDIIRSTGVLTEGRRIRITAIDRTVVDGRIAIEGRTIMGSDRGTVVRCWIPVRGSRNVWVA